MKPILQLCCLSLLITGLTSCKIGPFNLIKPATPHEQYQRKLQNAGLTETAMGKAWMEKASQSLQNPLSITLPYREQGYFAADRADAAAFSFTLQRGQKLQVKLTPQPAGTKIFMDVWEKEGTAQPGLLAAADTLGSVLQSDIDRSGLHILRLQPELLSGGSYVLEINTGPSLNYPLKSYSPGQIKSFWGDGRDADSRRHEGIDIFAPFRTPVIAVSAGTVTRVNENTLGGRVVWFRPEGKNYTLYYAHLDEQTVIEGQRVVPGDTLGRMGNTGNARTTSPHLHFGVYTNGGAIDPLPFVNPQTRTPATITVSTDRINATARLASNSDLLAGTGPTRLDKGTVLRVTAASGVNYRVQLPDGREGYIPGRNLSSVTSALLSYTLKDSLEVYDRPDLNAAIKTRLKTGDRVQVKGTFNNFRLIEHADGKSGWILAE